MASIEVISASTAEEFLELLRPSNDRWWDTDINQQTHYFRGHSDARWELLANGLRPMGPGHPLKHLFDRVRSHLRFYRMHEVWGERELNKRAWVYALDDACLRFGDVCRRIGLPADYAEYSSILDETEKWPDPKLHARTIEPHAQHHGVPSALLDWTESPLIAAFFAVEDPKQKGNPAVWAINISESTNDLRPPGTQTTTPIRYAFQPNFQNVYQRSQRGLFSRISDEIAWFDVTGRWPSLQEVHKYLEAPILTQLTLPRAQAAKLKRLLYREGISRAHLMPSYDNAAAETKAMFVPDYDF